MKFQDHCEFINFFKGNNCFAAKIIHAISWIPFPLQESPRMFTPHRPVVNVIQLADGLAIRIESSILRAYSEFLADLPATGDVALTIPAGSAQIHITICRTQPVAVEQTDLLTACEKFILDFISKSGRRLVAKEILAENDRRHEPWGHSTVQQALAALVARGLLHNARDRRGYWLTDEESQPIATA